MTDPDLSALGPLAEVIALTIRTTRVRLGVPEDLVAPLTVAVAAYMGKQLGPDPAALARLSVQCPDDAVAPVDGYEHRDALGILLSRMRRNVLLDGERRLLSEHVEQLLSEHDRLAARVALLENGAPAPAAEDVTP
ncbi:hypothetical protein OG530_19165 [Streptomyces decoyicus]|uniref:hypothetical protein n=1 Tax=Streptomyces decoyicus TaxID=249567 RepID=UPI002E1851A9